MERKSFPFELEEKGLDPEARTFQGFAAVMGNVDDGRDVIVKGAFTKTIKEMGDRVKIYYIHDFMQPIGKVIELREVPRGKLPQNVLSRAPDATGGLYVKGYISPTSIGNDALTLMRDTVLDELSIGYDSVKEEMKEAEDGEGMIRYLREIKLMDVSPVPLAMNAAAMITSVKAWLESMDTPTETDEDIRIISPAEDGSGVETTYSFAKENGWTKDAAQRWVEDHKKGQSLTDEVRSVETAFRRQYPYPSDGAGVFLYVDEVYEDHIIVSGEADTYYSVSYTRNGDDISFAARIEWIEGERVFVPTKQAKGKALDQVIGALIQRAQIQRQQIEEL